MLRRLIIAVAVALLAPGTAHAADRYTVTRPLASLRNAPRSFVIGHVFQGATVDVLARRGTWVYANAGGRCGWLMNRGLQPTGATDRAACPDAATLTPAALFAPGSYQRGCRQGCVHPARVIACPDRTVYANYDGTFRDPVGHEPRGRGTRGPHVPRYAGVRHGYPGFGLRYVTRDGVAALIKDARRGAPVWRFIRADCVERLSLVVTGHSIGAFRVRGGMRRAIRAFGRSYTRAGCTLSWRRPSLTLKFTGCRRFARGLVARQPIRGSALIHTWTTVPGLQLGDRVARLRALYPGGRRFRGTYRLEPGLRAIVAHGRVAAFRVSG